MKCSVMYALFKFLWLFLVSAVLFGPDVSSPLSEHYSSLMFDYEILYAVCVLFYGRQADTLFEQVYQSPQIWI